MMQHLLKLNFLSRKTIITLSVLATSLQAHWRPYTIKEGDTLGALTQKIGLNKWIWEKDGLVSKIYIKNHPPLESPDLIHPGLVIYLPQNNSDLLMSTDEVHNIIEEKNNLPQDNSNSFPLPLPLVSKKIESYKHHSLARLRIGAHTSLLNRSLTDKTSQATAKVNSNIIYGLYLDARFPINNSWFIDSSLNVKKITFANSTTRTFITSSDQYLKLSLGASRKQKDMHIGFGINYESFPLITGSSQTSVSVSPFNFFSPYINADWTLYTWGKTILNTEAIFLYNLKMTKENVELINGFDLQLLLNIERKLSDSLNYSLSPYVQVGEKETSTVNHDDLDFGMRFTLNWFH